MHVEVIIPSCSTSGGPARLATIADLLYKGGWDVKLRAIKPPVQNVYGVSVPIVSGPIEGKPNIIITFADHNRGDDLLAIGADVNILLVLGLGVEAKMEMHNIRRSEWHKASTTVFLKREVEKIGQPCVQIRFGLDDMVGGQRIKFFPTPTQHRTGVVTIMHHNSATRKGFYEGIRAIEHAAKMGVVERVQVFGQREKHIELSSEYSKYEYYYKPTGEKLRELYSNSSAFVWPAHQGEGLGMPPLEALLCGCGVVTYDNGGASELLHHGHTALVCKDGDWQMLRDNLVQILSSPSLTEEMVVNFKILAKPYTWINVMKWLKGMIYDIAMESQ